MRVAPPAPRSYEVTDGFSAYQANLRLANRRSQSVVGIQKIWERLALHLLNSAQLTIPWSLGITSAISGEGKTTCSIGLAVALAKETGGRVALVEASIQEPSIARDFSVRVSPGLVDYLLGKCFLEATFRDTSLANLALLPAGEVQERSLRSPSSTFTSNLRRRLPEVLALLQRQFSHIVLDLPPVLADVNTVEMAKLSDGTLFLVQAGLTPREKVREATGLLGLAPLLGIIHLGPDSAIPRWLSQIIED